MHDATHNTIQNKTISYDTIRNSQFAIHNTFNAFFKYKIQYTIGDGAYGVVYRARDVVTNQKVALKRIKLENEDGK